MDALERIRSMEEILQGAKPVLARLDEALEDYAALTDALGALAGLDTFTAFTGALSMVGNIGPAFGQLGPTSNYGALAAPLKWFYMFAMLAGRLEIYTLLILVGRICFLRRQT